MKRIKTPEELKYMAHSFHQADRVIKKSIDWLNKEINSGETVSERDFSDKVKDTFFAHEAKSLSFEVITASGENAAIVHYTKADPNKILKAGDLMLLDTGAYFEGGYATDLTRTFLIGGSETKATVRQQEIYTLVLKSAIRVLKARFPMGTKGIHLDTLARAPLWDYGYIYNHGTGHGVGICVHEVPPRVSSTSDDVLEESMVFSVEPGLYIEGYGGVRIENLVTLVRDPQYDGWLQVQPLTFAPLDKNLIDYGYLDRWEKEWLKEYMEKSAGLDS
ncbi:MAG TPA: M24 family metallopeptidase [Spirochaetes bacterium]|nr:M24 family metallopeptidase [Spirochaetota bacterium]